MQEETLPTCCVSRRLSMRHLQLAASDSPKPGGTLTHHPLSFPRVEPSVSDSRLEQLDRVSGWVLDQDLLPTDACHDLVAKVRSGGTQGRNRRLKIIDLYGESIPPAGLRFRAVRHGLTPTAYGIGRTEDETEVAS